MTGFEHGDRGVGIMNESQSHLHSIYLYNVCKNMKNIDYVCKILVSGTIFISIGAPVNEAVRYMAVKPIIMLYAISRR